ncbi:MAG: hypothetical protein WBA53_13100, partial [Burkholderiaceae bacterium]
MPAFPSERRRSKLPIVVILILILVAAMAGGAWFLSPRFESEPPQITLSSTADVLGVAPLEIKVTDKGTGLKSFKATLSQGGMEHSLASEQFDRPIGEKKIAVALAKVSGVKEGPAVLRVSARDSALFSGNEAVLEKNITIDITPPTLELVADDRYVN